jgi:hypothetical protein
MGIKKIVERIMATANLCRHSNPFSLHGSPPQGVYAPKKEKPGFECLKPGFKSAFPLTIPYQSLDLLRLKKEGSKKYYYVMIIEFLK